MLPCSGTCCHIFTPVVVKADAGPGSGLQGIIAFLRYLFTTDVSTISLLPTLSACVQLHSPPTPAQSPVILLYPEDKRVLSECSLKTSLRTFGCKQRVKCVGIRRNAPLYQAETCCATTGAYNLNVIRSDAFYFLMLRFCFENMYVEITLDETPPNRSVFFFFRLLHIHHPRRVLIICNLRT